MSMEQMIDFYLILPDKLSELHHQLHPGRHKFLSSGNFPADLYLEDLVISYLPKPGKHLFDHNHLQIITLEQILHTQSPK